ncbi:MAG: hypothetical protein R3C39_12065 [Dehalococcoidia bacterium]
MTSMLRVVGGWLAFWVGASAALALAAGLALPLVSVHESTAAQGVDDVKPAECAALTLTSLVTGSGTITGTAGDDLILGSSGSDSITGGGGRDCILGGGGDDTIDGEGDDDVLLGGAGTDICIGGGDPGDAFPDGTCETVIP